MSMCVNNDTLNHIDVDQNERTSGLLAQKLIKCTISFHAKMHLVEM